MTVGAMSTVTNLFDGAVTAYSGPITLGTQDTSTENASLITVLPDLNVSNVDFTGSTLFLSAQVTNESTNALGQLVIPILLSILMMYLSQHLTKRDIRFNILMEPLELLKTTK